jgi:hypothetical protein
MHKWKFLTAAVLGACLGTWVTMWIGHTAPVVSAKEPSLTALDYQ